MRAPTSASIDDELEWLLFKDLVHQLPPSTRLQLLADYVAELADDAEMFSQFQAGVEMRLLQQDGSAVARTGE